MPKQTSVLPLVLPSRPAGVPAGRWLYETVRAEILSGRLRRGARIEVVKGEAAEALNDRGGIAAFLKARTATVNL